MELKDFVSGTLIQITEGVKDAQEKCKPMGGLINPMLKVSNNYNGDKYSHDDSDYPATKVYFKVGLTESDCKGNKSGIGVFLGHISIGNEADNGDVPGRCPKVIRPALPDTARRPRAAAG